MSKRILVPVDGSPQSEDALEFAAREWPDATLELLHVIDPVEAGYNAGRVPSTGEEWYENAVERAEDYFDEAREQVDNAVTTRTEVGRPAATIVDVAEEDEVDLVVIGSHGRKGISRILLGSVAESVVRESPVPVTIVR
ncbi:MAG: universal stress protein [Haloferacaceae archaeon]